MADIIPLKPGMIGSGIHIEPDQVLEMAKGKFTQVIVVGMENGELVISGSDGQEMALWMLFKAQIDLIA